MTYKHRKKKRLCKQKAENSRFKMPFVTQSSFNFSSNGILTFNISSNSLNKLMNKVTHRLSCSKGSRNAFRRRRRGRRGGLRPHGATSLAHEGTRRSPVSASLPPSRTPSAGRNRPSNILCDIAPVERWPLKNFDLQETSERNCHIHDDEQVPP